MEGYKFCRFCGGLGCLACPTEETRAQTLPNGGFRLVFTLNEDEMKDPKVWKILKPAIGPDIMMKAIDPQGKTRAECLMLLAKGEWGQPLLLRQLEIAKRQLMQYLIAKYKEAGKSRKCEGTAFTWYVVDTGA